MCWPVCSAAEVGAAALREERGALAAERLRRSGAAAAEVREALAPVEAEHVAAMRRLEARADAARSEAAASEAQKSSLEEEMAEAAAAVREAERGATSRQRSSLRGLRRVRAQADASEAAVRALRKELRLLRARVEAARDHADASSSASSSSAAASGSAVARTDLGDGSLSLPEDVESEIAQLKARVTLLRAASERSPERRSGASVRAQWADTLDAARERKEAAAATLPEAREGAAKAGQQLASLIESMLPGDSMQGRAAGQLVRRLLQHGGSENWASLRPMVAAVATSETAADAALATLTGMRVVKRAPDDKIEFCIS